MDLCGRDHSLHLDSNLRPDASPEGPRRMFRTPSPRQLDIYFLRLFELWRLVLPGNITVLTFLFKVVLL